MTNTLGKLMADMPIHSYTFKVYLKSEYLKDICVGTPLLVNPTPNIEGVYFLDIDIVADCEETALDVMRDFYPTEMFVVRLVAMDGLLITESPNIYS